MEKIHYYSQLFTSLLSRLRRGGGGLDVVPVGRRGLLGGAHGKMGAAGKTSAAKKKKASPRAAPGPEHLEVFEKKLQNRNVEMSTVMPKSVEI